MTIDEAKRLLSLPELMHRLGYGDCARRRACCPFHDDQHASFSMYRDEKGYFHFKCHAGCGGGDQINFLELAEKLSQKNAVRRFLELAGGNTSKPFVAARGVETGKEVLSSDATTATPKPFDWQECVDAFTDADALHLTLQRRHSVKLYAWLQENGLIGLYGGCFAFPVHDRAGNVVAVHYRLKDGSWRYFPQGAQVRPLTIGELVAGDPVHVFESQWDAFAFMDKSGERSGIIITRGASNGGLVAGLIPEGSTVYLWTQNDAAGEKWQKDICANSKTTLRRVKIPAQHKDLNDWTLTGATDKNLLGAIVDADEAATVEAQSRAAKLAPLLDSICIFVRRYIVFPLAEQPIAIALWVVHCWVIDAFDYTPYVHINSPEKQCGKTRLFDCLELLILKVWRAILPSEAVLFRKVETDRPTLLLDEVDSIFTNNGKDEKREALRSLLNAGFERGAKVPRCVGHGSNYQVQEFAVFCAKALAGIGRLPDTITDRSVPIQLVRRASDEKVERFRKREAEKGASVIRAELEAWAKPDIIKRLREARPSLPEALSDRQQDICEPLLAIAEMAGGDWRERARAALVALCSQTDDNESLGVKLLSDIRQVFDSAKSDKIATLELLKFLVELETDAPWASWWEADLKNGNTRGPAQKLAKLLGAYKIKPEAMRLPDGSTPRGYRIEHFYEAWKRYLPTNAVNNATTQRSDEVAL